MSSSKKEGGKNRKIGRHSRNPSSRMQAQRTAKNKAKRAQKVVHVPEKVNNAKISASGRHVWGYVGLRGVRERVYCL